MSTKPASYIFALTFLASVPTSVPAHAATPKASFSVSVTVLPYCAASASPMRFGNRAGSAASATSTVSVKCNDTVSTPYNVRLSTGLAPSAAAASRVMIGPGSAPVGYSLRSDMRGVVKLGQAVKVNAPAESDGAPVQMLSVPGQIPAGQNAADEAYADIVTVSITY